MKITTTKVLLIICLILLGLTTFFYFKSRKTSSDLQNQQNLVGALTDTLKIFRNKDSSTIAVIQSYALTQSDLIHQIKDTKDSATLELQKMETKYHSKIKNGGSLTTMSMNTNINTTNKSDVQPKDSINKNGIIYIYPMYTSKFNSKWFSGGVIANRDSVSIQMSIHNEIDAIIYKDKGVWNVEAIMKNPYSETKTLRALNVIGPNPKRFGLGFHAGYGIGYFNKEMKFVPYIGVGINYNILEF